MTDYLIRVDEVTKYFPISRGERVHALNGVSFEVDRGERIGIVGESGSGKSTLASLLLLLDRPDTGTLTLLGRDSRSIRGDLLKDFRRRVQMVFQDPFDSLNPRIRVGSTIEEPLLLTGVPRSEREARINEICRRLGLARELMSRWPHQLSGGQQQRVGIARALIAGADVLVLDEPTSSLDVSVRAEILELLADLKESLNLTYIFISHDLLTVRAVCDRVLVMYLGRIVEAASVEQLFRSPLHPYSRALIGAALIAGTERLTGRLELVGDPPSSIHLPIGCALAPRCPLAQPSCHENAQRLVFLGGRQVACEVVTRELLVVPAGLEDSSVVIESSHAAAEDQPSSE